MGIFRRLLTGWRVKGSGKTTMLLRSGWPCPTIFGLLKPHGTFSTGTGQHMKSYSQSLWSILLRTWNGLCVRRRKTSTQASSSFHTLIPSIALTSMND